MARRQSKSGRDKATGRYKVHVRRGDRVKVIRGNYAGSVGTVLRVLPKENRVVVEGVNLRKRHRRPTPDNPEGGIITFEAPIHASNVMLIDPTTGEPTRVRKRIVEGDGTTKRSRLKERISVRSGNPIPKAGA